MGALRDCERAEGINNCGTLASRAQPDGELGLKRWSSIEIVIGVVFLALSWAVQSALANVIGGFPALLVVLALGLCLRAIAERYEPR
jgi:hypothetical protein